MLNELLRCKTGNLEILSFSKFEVEEFVAYPVGFSLVAPVSPAENNLESNSVIAP